MKTRLSALPIVIVLLLSTLRISAGGDYSRTTLAANTEFVYLPLVFKPPIDLTITGLEVTQSVQTTSNSVPLVANRPAVARVYAEVILGAAQSGVTVSLSATRDSASLGSMTVGPQTVPTSADRGDYNSTFNATLPAGWLSGDVDLTVTVDSANVIGEASESNNASSISLNFNDVPALDVKIVPIDYTHEPSGVFYPGQQEDKISDWLMRAYPVGSVNITFRSAYAFSGDLRTGGDWSQLLYQVTDLKGPDNAPSSQVYYALVPISNGSSQWFYGGIAGVGWIGWRASVGLNLDSSEDSGTLAGHEIGHNFGRYHALCGGPSGVDPSYPYSGASIGEYGLDVPNNLLLSPGAYVDVMSYCGPEWVSDYTYLALYNNQLANGLSVGDPAVQSMMIRARFDDDGVPALQPVYTFSRLPEPAAIAGDYAVELLAADGEVIAIHPVTVLEAAEEGVAVRAIHATVPVPETAVASVRLVESGTAIAQRELNQAPFSQTAAPVLAQTAGTITLTWGAPETPAIVRYTADDGQSWTTLGIDVLGGQLTVAMKDLPGGNGRFQIIPADSPTPTVLTAELVTN